MKHIPHLKDLAAADIRAILAKAAEIKANPGDFRQALAGESLAMLFQKTSTRTRVSFEVAMTELGGHGIYIDWTTSNFVLTSIEHETQYLSRNVSCIMARLLHHHDLLKINSASQVPVINGCCEKFHPCQALTDLLTVNEHFDGDLTDARLMYTGVQNNVSNSLAIICDKLGVRLTLATPVPEGNGETQDAQVQQIISAGKNVTHTTSPADAIDQVDFIYTDTWVDMQHFNNPGMRDENEARIARMKPYQINHELIGDRSLKIMHDMPIHDGYEITTEATRDPRSIIYEQAANRLHAQKGLLVWLFEQARQTG